MDAVTNETVVSPRAQAPSLSRNPVIRQLAVMVGIAASVAIGVAVVLWSWTPSYSLLFGNLAQKDASEVVAALQQAGIDYEVNQETGAVMVPSGKVQEARMKLAGQGLPHSDSLGYELLQQETGFGTSRALEAARFHRALEGELARTISTLAHIHTGQYSNRPGTSGDTQAIRFRAKTQAAQRIHRGEALLGQVSGKRPGHVSYSSCGLQRPGPRIEPGHSRGSKRQSAQQPDGRGPDDAHRLPV